MRVLLRADATPSIGTGHVMRCMALALAARELGADASLCGRVTVPWVARRLESEAIPFLPLHDPLPEREDADALLEIVGKNRPDSVVLDGYHFGTECQRAVKSAVDALMVIDDCNHLAEYCADFLLNQNLGAENLPYRGDIGEKLLGPGYALLRPEFRKAREPAEKRVFPETPRNVLLTLGGGDFGAHLDRIAPGLNMPELEGKTVRVVAGGTPDDRIGKALAECPASVEILRRVDDMPGLLLDTDLCVTAGGSTCWELCCLGVPFLVVETAANQREPIREIVRSNASVPFSPAAFRDMLSRSALRRAMRKRIMSLVGAEGGRAAASRMVDRNANHI